MKYRFWAGLGLAFAVLAAPLWASDLSERGTRLFLDNKPAEAAPVLELAAKEAGADERLYLYLGVAYQQLGRWDDAIGAFRKGLATAIQYRHTYQFNIANSFFAQGKTSFAIEYYDQAIASDTRYAPAYLNRANARFKTGDLKGAVEDYSTYLALEPSSPQAPMIRALLDRIAAKAASDELAKAAAAAAAAAEAAARQALLDQVAQSLLDGSGDTTSLSAGTGSLEGYVDELPLDEEAP